MLTQQELSDRIEIGDLLTRYTRAIDLGRWDDLDAVFTPDAHIDYTATGGTVGESSAATTTTDSSAHLPAGARVSWSRSWSGSAACPRADRHAYPC